MSISKRNCEGYLDLTAYEAMSIMERSERRKRKPCVFICSPYAGDVECNIENARRYLLFAVKKGAIPFAPHLLYPQVMDDADPGQRELGIEFSLAFLSRCDALWVFGGRVSQGMRAEIIKAMRRGMTIRFFNDQCQEVQPYENII